MVPEGRIVVATRTTADGIDKCLQRFRDLDCHEVRKFIVVCDHRGLRERTVGTTEKKVEFAFDEKPTRPCGLNVALELLTRDESRDCHLFTFSKEVEVTSVHLLDLLRRMGSAVAAGYRLRDNVTSEAEMHVFSNALRQPLGAAEEPGLAYCIPWNTCMLWNSDVVLGGNGSPRLRFDELCEDNQLGSLAVSVEGREIQTPYKGMEDGLAIARLLSFPANRHRTCLLCDFEGQPLSWNVSSDEAKRQEHKAKMARKNIVLSAFMGMKGYSVERLREAAKLPEVD
jgi:hypothetical protein